MPTVAERRWEPIVRQARLSGGSIRAYARLHGINESTLAWWNWRFGDDLDRSDFTEVVVDEPRSVVRLQLGAVRIDVDEQTDLNLLRRVVGALS